MKNERTNVGQSNVSIGDQGEVWFASQLPLGWIWQPPRLDLGKDGVVVIRDQTELHNLEFSIQVKSSKKIVPSRGNIVIRGVSRSSIMYWFASPLPTLVIAVDVSTNAAWYAWHMDLFDSPSDVFRVEKKEFSVRIPVANKLDGASWALIRDYLHKHYGELHSALTQKTAVVRVVASIHLMSTALRNLVKLLDHPIPLDGPSSEQGITLLLEMIQHRDLLAAARFALRRIKLDSSPYKQVLFNIETYVNLARSSFPLLEKLPEEAGDNSFPSDFELAYAPKMVVENRHRLIDTGLGLLELLTTVEKMQDESSAT